MPPTCTPPFYPDPGVTIATHSAGSKCRFYVVKKGRTIGIFTNHLRTNDQVLGHPNAASESAFTYDDALVIWRKHCCSAHQEGGVPCPYVVSSLGGTVLWGVRGFHRTCTTRQEAVDLALEKYGQGARGVLISTKDSKALYDFIHQDDIKTEQM
ncbi:hypothetical protein B0H15DRAFT_855862 [Mycena belliarum]|uniref:Ribonuclease H1 N-terminal domain-containing protein n=1 Tax=Mycena belliarum TaxID=1033014 RepID=A0AAD6TXB8_9AGAR|nr:hypothetical protein B0H15DRAFT_855862 [Mycena belliae]